MTDIQLSEEPAVVVIGGGQTGLATAYWLSRLHVPCVVLDENARVGDQWRRRYDSLRLNTPAAWDGLPGMRFPAASFSFPTGRQMGAFLEEYARTFHLDIRTGTTVQRVDQEPDGRWRITTRDDEFISAAVVVAVGGEPHPKVPPFANRLDPGIRQLHSSDYHRPSQLLPGPVLVVGAGQSGADLALEAARAGHETTLAGRINGEIPFHPESWQTRLAAPVLWFLARRVLTTRTAWGRRAQPEVRTSGTPLVRVHRVDLDAAGVKLAEQRVTDARDGKPVLDDGRALDVANVIWCTGFRHDFGFIHPSVVDETGWPVDVGGVVPTMPGLYFVGLIFQRGFYSMLIRGAGVDARWIARQVARRLSRQADVVLETPQLR